MSFTGRKDRVSHIGERFGRLVVEEELPPKYYVNKKGQKCPIRYFRCRCDCGNYRDVQWSNLRTGKVRSCGCLSKEYNESRVNNLLNQKFGRLTVIDSAPPRNNKNKTRMWKCQCECGNIIIVDESHLLDGHTKSCGCIRGESRITHGHSGTRIYSIYKHMLTRCYNPDADNYKDYGYRGIYVCDEWKNDVNEFVTWAYANGYHDPLPGEPKKEWLSIERVDVNGPYAPWNCIWIKRYKQAENTRANKYIYDGNNIFKYFEFCRYYDVDEHFISHRVYAGWSLNAIVYAAKHKEREIRKGRDGNYYDKNGFMILIPSYYKMKRKDLAEIMKRYE